MITAIIPVQAVSVMNLREHFGQRARRAKQHRVTAWGILRQENGPVEASNLPQSLRVTLTRIAPRKLDGDNLQASLKAVRDGVADWLKIDDGSVRIEWLYGQESRKARQYEVHVTIEGKQP